MTNWKYILIILILAAIVGGGILLWQSQLRLENGIHQITIEENECVNSGGTVKGLPACNMAGDFQDSCISGLGFIFYDCVPHPAAKVKICECGNGKCFDGEKCVLVGIVEKTEDALKNSTQHWKTYRNEKFGFEIEFPASLFGFLADYSFIVNPVIGIGEPLSNYNDVCKREPSLPINIQIFERERTEYPADSYVAGLNLFYIVYGGEHGLSIPKRQFNIRVWANPENLDFVSYSQKYCMFGLPDSVKYNYDIGQIYLPNNLIVTKLINKNYKVDEVPFEESALVGVAAGNNLIIEINSTEYESINEAMEDNVFDQILSTLRFLE